MHERNLTDVKRWKRRKVGSWDRGRCEDGELGGGGGGGGRKIGIQV